MPGQGAHIPFHTSFLLQFAVYAVFGHKANNDEMHLAIEFVMPQRGISWVDNNNNKRATCRRHVWCINIAISLRVVTDKILQVFVFYL